MCECGCVTRGQFIKFPGPGKQVYVMHIYPGCPDCEAPVGVTVTLHKNVKEAEWIHGQLDTPQYYNVDNQKEFSIPVVDPLEVIKEVVDLVGDFVDPESKEPFTVKEMIEDIEDKAAYDMTVQAAMATRTSNELRDWDVTLADGLDDDA